MQFRRVDRFNPLSNKIHMEIYLIENLINNKKYVGMTTKSINCRFSEHKTKSTQKLTTNNQMIHTVVVGVHGVLVGLHRHTTCQYIHIHTYTHVYTHIPIYTYRYLQIHAIYMNTYNTLIYVRIHTYTNK